MSSERESSTTDVSSLANETQEKLAEIWNELGVGAEERSTFLSTLRAEVEGIFRDRVAGEMKRKEAALEINEGKKREIAAVASRLDIDPEYPEMEGGASIMDIQTALDERLETVTKVLNERVATLKELYGKLVELHKALDTEIAEDFKEMGERATTTRIQAFRGQIREAEGVRAERVGQITGRLAEAEKLWEEFAWEFEGEAVEFEESAVEDVQGVNAFDRAFKLGSDGIGVTAKSVEYAQRRVKALQEEHGRREEYIASVGKEITALWVKLGTPEEEQSAFLESYTGVGDATVKAVEEYLSARRGEFASKIGELLERARERVRGLWSELRCPVAEGVEECPEAAEDWTFPADADAQEAAFTKVHNHAEELSERLEAIKPLLKLVERRTAILGDKDEYERIISDPSRLLSRGGGAQRLKEERLEKRIKKELPLVTRKLLRATAEYEASTGREFRIDGARATDAIEAEVREEEEAKRKAAAMRKRSRVAPNELASSKGAMQTKKRSVSRSRSASRPRSSSVTSTNNTSTTSTATSTAAPAPAPAPAAAKKRPLGRSKGVENKKKATITTSSSSSTTTTKSTTAAPSQAATAAPPKPPAGPKPKKKTNDQDAVVPAPAPAEAVQVSDDAKTGAAAMAQAIEAD